jgi:hypothetical protein
MALVSRRKLAQPQRPNVDPAQTRNRNASLFWDDDAGFSPMRVIGLALAGLMAVGLAADGAQDRGLRGSSPMLLLYVGAEDCGPCRAWRRDHKPAFLSGVDPHQVRYREVIAPRLLQAFEASSWPADLHEYRAIAEGLGGVPVWLVIRDRRVVAKAGGLSLWRTRVLPLVEDAARRG